MSLAWKRLLGLAPLLSGCVYYNAMWSAERLANEARREEAQGQIASAKLTWARAAVKAESIAIRHPTSRWADDALTLQVEGLANSGACVRIDAPLARAQATVSDAALKERLALAGAKCALAEGQPGLVAAMLKDVLQSNDGDRRSTAYDLLGQSAAARADWTQAIDAFGRSQTPRAAMGRARALLASGRLNEARAYLDSLAGKHFDDSLWAAALSDVARAAGDSMASVALDTVLLRSRMHAGEKARLLLADGDRLRLGGRHAAAIARYDLVHRLVSDSMEGAQAEVRELLAAAGTSQTPAEIVPIAARLNQIVARGGGPAEPEAVAAQHLLTAVGTPDSTDIAWFRAGEIARDSLVAPALAATWFGRIPKAFPHSLFAPKALIALVQIRPAATDSVLAVLDSNFAASPYTLALRGDVSPAYQALEDSLGQAFGLSRVRARAVLTLLIGGPVPGEKGPQLEPGDAVAAAARPAGRAGAGRPGAGPAVRREPARPPAGQGPRPAPGAPADAADRP